MLQHTLKASLVSIEDSVFCGDESVKRQSVFLLLLQMSFVQVLMMHINSCMWHAGLEPRVMYGTCQSPW